MADVLVRTRNVERTKSGDGSTHHGPTAAATAGGSGTTKTSKKRGSGGSTSGAATVCSTGTSATSKSNPAAAACGEPVDRSNSKKKGHGNTAAGSGSGSIPPRLKRHSSGVSKDGTVGSSLSAISRQSGTTETTTASTTIRGKRRTSSRSSVTTHSTTASTTSSSINDSRHGNSNSSNCNGKEKDHKKTKSKRKPCPNRAKSFDGCSIIKTNSSAHAGPHAAAATTTTRGAEDHHGEQRTPPPSELRKQRSASELLSAGGDGDHDDGERRTKPHQHIQQQQEQKYTNRQKPMPDFGFDTPKNQIVHDLFVKRRSYTDDEHQNQMLVPSLTNSTSSHEEEEDNDDDDDDTYNLKAQSTGARATVSRQERKTNAATKRDSFTKKRQIPKNAPRTAPSGRGSSGGTKRNEQGDDDGSRCSSKQHDRPKSMPVRRYSSNDVEDSTDDDESDAGTKPNHVTPTSRARSTNDNDSSIRGSKHSRQQLRAPSSQFGSPHSSNNNSNGRFGLQDESSEASLKHINKNPPKLPERSSSNRGKSNGRATAPSSLLKAPSSDAEIEEDENDDNFHHSSQPSAAASKPDGGCKRGSKQVDATETVQRATIDKTGKKKDQTKGYHDLENDESERDDDRRRTLCGFLPSKPKPQTGSASVVSANMPDLMDSSFSSLKSNDDTVCTFLSQKKPGLVVESEVQEGPMKDFLGNLTAAIHKKKTVSGSFHSAGSQSNSSRADSNQSPDLPKHCLPAHDETKFASCNFSHLNAPTTNGNSLQPSERKPSLGATLKKQQGGCRQDGDDMSLPSLMSYRKKEQREQQAYDDGGSIPSLTSFRTNGTNQPDDFDEMADCSMPSLKSMPDDPSVASLPAFSRVRSPYAAARGCFEEEDAEVEEGCGEEAEGEEEYDDDEPSEFEESMTEVEDEICEQELDDEDHDLDALEAGEEALEHSGEEAEDDGSLEADEEDVDEDVNEPAIVHHAPRAGKGRDQRQKKQPANGRRRSSKQQPEQPPRHDAMAAPALQYVVAPKMKTKKKKRNAKEEEQVLQWQEEFQQEQLLQQQQMYWQQQVLQQQLLQQQYWMQNPGMAVPALGMDMDGVHATNYMGHNMDPSNQGMNIPGIMVDHSGTGTMTGSSGRDSMGMSNSNHSDAKSKKSSPKKSQSLDYDFSFLDHPEMPEVSEVSADDVLVPMHPSIEGEDSNDPGGSKPAARGSRGKKEKEKKAPALSFTSRFKNSVKLIKNNFAGGKQKSTRVDTGLNDKQFFPDLDDDDDEEYTMQGLLSRSG